MAAREDLEEIIQQQERIARKEYPIEAYTKSGYLSERRLGDIWLRLESRRITLLEKVRAELGAPALAADTAEQRRLARLLNIEETGIDDDRTPIDAKACRAPLSPARFAVSEIFEAAQNPTWSDAYDYETLNACLPGAFENIEDD